MGIKDLLKFMKPYTEPIHIKKYAGKRVGIDAYSWLHKGAYSCSMEICLDSKGDKKLRYLDYFMHRIDLLRYNNITPVVVFDGGNMPCKAATEQERQRKRKANLDLAMEKLKEGNVTAAGECFQRAVSITPLMAYQLVQILRLQSIEFVVAPYEADAQLAYLSSLEPENGGIAAVITEDSDLLAYGCQATIFKMDRFGNAVEIVLDKVFDSMTCKPSFQHFDKELFLGMCVLAGCDFLPSIPGIGIVKAYSIISKYRNIDRALSVLKLEKGRQMPEDYSKSFKEALAVFQHALMSIRQQQQDTKTHETTSRKSFGAFGEIPLSVATAIAEGKLNPVTMEAFDSFSSFEYYPDPIVLQNPCKNQSSGATEIRGRYRGSVDFFSHQTREKGMEGKEDPVSSERKFIKEALALKKLVSPQKVKKTKKVAIPSNLQLKVPNNPFRIRKVEEICLEQNEDTSDQIVVVIDDEKQDELCITPYESSCLTPDNIMPKHLDDCISKRRKLDKDHLEQSRITEEASMVTEVGDSDILYVTNESQESVNSKPKKISEGKGKRKDEKQKRNNGTTMNNKNTILSFFSRV
ncbi:hypothetical protein Tsubulata_027815 [Turnera subulata]|uniref:Exonuclease 1 n=1 Tax=Turnera subulata TaxID=218843 RepID=A0A9Q0J8I8_9ROSI|nr:hypothetical protein Tsubulata_027815 [Turnera subulata]